MPSARAAKSTHAEAPKGLGASDALDPPEVPEPHGALDPPEVPEPHGALDPPEVPEPHGGPASQRVLRSQGKRTMRKLLDAAMEVFSQRGYHAARVDDIVKLARTSHGTFYLYFSNKEDLLHALVHEAGEVVIELDTALGPIDPGPEGWTALREWMERFSDAWLRYAPVLQAWTDLLVSDQELTAEAHAASTGVASTLARRIAEANPGPGIEPNAAAEAVIAMIDRFHYIRRFAEEPVDSQAVDTLTTMVHRAVFNGTGPPGSAALLTRRPNRKPVVTEGAPGPNRSARTKRSRKTS